MSEVRKRILARAKSGNGAVTVYEETQEERARRIERAGQESAERVRFTEGQYQTLRRAMEQLRNDHAS